MPVKILSLLTVGRFSAAPQPRPGLLSAGCLSTLASPQPASPRGGGGATSSQVPLGIQCPSAPHMFPRASPAEVAVILGVVSVNFWSHGMIPSLLLLCSFFSFSVFLNSLHDVTRG